MSEVPIVAATVVEERVNTGKVKALGETVLLAVRVTEPAAMVREVTPELPTKIDDVMLMLDAFNVRPISSVAPSMRTPLSPWMRICSHAHRHQHCKTNHPVTNKHADLTLLHC